MCGMKSENQATKGKKTKKLGSLRRWGKEKDGRMSIRGGLCGWGGVVV